MAFYVERQNGQKENTPTVIVNIGDNRNLKWRRCIIKYNISTRRHRWEVDKTWSETMHISSGSIVIVNPLDEIPCQHPTLGMFIQYQHGGVVVKENKFSCAFAFRIVKHKFLYNKNNEMIVDVSKVSEKENVLMN